MSSSSVSRGSVPLTGPMISMQADLRASGIESSQEENVTYGNLRSTLFSSSGLAAVWSEENTRDSLFAALKRKETYATSGTRIKLRFFSGYKITSLNLNDPDLIEKAYAAGVPMGLSLIHI